MTAQRQRPTQSIAIATRGEMSLAASAWPHMCADWPERTLERVVGNSVELATSQAFALCTVANWIPQ